MGYGEFLLLLLVCWTVVGVVGVTISVIRMENAKALRNFGWIVGVWAVYLIALLSVSLLSHERTVALGQPQCFGKLCYTVDGREEIPGYLAGGSRLVRVKMTIQNKSADATEEPRLSAYLVDQRGRRWDEVPGLSGIRLSSHVPARATLVSEPVFKLPNDATPTSIVLTRGPLQPRRLVVGDRDSLLHPPTVALLAR